MVRTTSSHRHLAALGGFMAKGDPAAVCNTRVRPCVQQSVHDVHVPVHGGAVERGAAVGRCCIGVTPSPEQQLHTFHSPLSGGVGGCMEVAGRGGEKNTVYMS